MLSAFIIVKLRKEDNPMVGTSTTISGIVPNSFSKDVNLVEALCDKLNKKNNDATIKYKVEQVNEIVKG